MLLGGAVPAMAVNVSSSKMIDIARQVSEMFPVIYQTPVPNDSSLYIGAQIPTYRVSSGGNLVASDYESYSLNSVYTSDMV